MTIQNDRVEYVKIEGLIRPDGFTDSTYQPLIPTGRWKLTSWYGEENVLYIESFNGGYSRWFKESSIVYGPKPNEYVFEG